MGLLLDTGNACTACNDIPCQGKLLEEENSVFRSSNSSGISLMVIGHVMSTTIIDRGTFAHTVTLVKDEKVEWEGMNSNSLRL